MAVKRDNMEVTKELLRLNYDLQMPKNNGVTALGIAALSNKLEMFSMLIDAGADPAHSNSQGIGALYLAIKGKSTNIIEALIRLKVPIFNNEAQKADNSPIFYAIKAKYMEALEIFADLGTQQMNFYINSTGHNALTYAASIGNFEAVDYLSQRGMLPDVEDRDGKTVLVRVLEAYNFELANKLIRRGANVNSVNREGKTALSIFLLQHRTPIVEYLIKNQADPHIEDFNGRDSCNYAELNNIYNFPELLRCEPKLRKKATLDES